MLSLMKLKTKPPGSELANVTRRLNLLYGKSHQLIITKNNSFFIIYLQLNLSK